MLWTKCNELSTIKVWSVFANSFDIGVVSFCNVFLHTICNSCLLLCRKIKRNLEITIASYPSKTSKGNNRKQSKIHPFIFPMRIRLYAYHQLRVWRYRLQTHTLTHIRVFRLPLHKYCFSFTYIYILFTGMLWERYWFSFDEIYIFLI